MPIRRPLFVLSVVAILLLVSACSFGSGPNALSSQQATSTAAAQSSAALPAEETATPTATPEPFSGDGPWEINFTTSDGVTLYGILYGQGQVALILAPTYPGGLEGWRPFAEKIAAQGHRVFTFDFRGQGKSEGTRSSADAPTDLTAAITVMRENIAERIVVFGAGLGGMAAIRSAPQSDAVIGLAVLSGARSFDGLDISDSDLAAVAIPSVWFGTRNDMTQNVEDMYNLAGGSDKQIWIYEGSSLHGTFMLEGADAPDLERRLLEFIVHVTGE